MIELSPFEQEVVNFAAGFALDDEKICEELIKYFDLNDEDLERIKEKFYEYLCEV